jgi:hypothetical protein
MIGSGSASGFIRGRIRIHIKMIWIRNTGLDQCFTYLFTCPLVLHGPRGPLREHPSWRHPRCCVRGYLFLYIDTG